MIALWALAALPLIVDTVWLPLSSMDLRVDSLLCLALLALSFAGLAGIYIFFRPEQRLAVTALVLCQTIVFSVLGAITSYLTVSLGGPLQDTFLAHADETLGFDWVSYTTFLRGHDLTNMVLGWAYSTTICQIFVLIAVFGLTGRFHSLYRLTGISTLGMIMTIIVSGSMPAVGAYLHYGQPPLGGGDYGIYTRAVHDGLLRVIDFDTLHGLISFPSFHTVLSVAMILSAWSSRWLRYPVLLLQSMVLISVPAFGEHYLSDVIVGASLALLSDRTWQWLLQTPRHSSSSLRGQAAGTAEG